MLRASVAFFVLALVAYFLGANGVAGMSMEIGRICIGVFIFIAILTFIGSLFNRNRSKQGL